MGTDKRERQKANRQLKLQEIAREARKRKTKRRALQIGIGIPVLIALVFVLVRLVGGSDNTIASTSASSTPLAATSTVAATSTTLVPPTPLGCPKADGTSAKQTTFPAAPTMCIDVTKTYTVTVVTNKGTYKAVLDAKKAPLTVNNFVYLARYHYYDNTPCHRIIKGFVVQCGDPTGKGDGGPGYSFADELPKAGDYKLGSLAMANSGANTNGSQFFVISGDQGVALPPKYSLFGQVTDGLDTTVKALNALGSADNSGTSSQPVTINSVSVAES